MIYWIVGLVAYIVVILVVARCMSINNAPNNPKRKDDKWK